MTLHHLQSALFLCKERMYCRVVNNKQIALVIYITTLLQLRKINSIESTSMCRRYTNTHTHTFYCSYC